MEFIIGGRQVDLSASPIQDLYAFRGLRHCGNCILVEGGLDALVRLNVSKYGPLPDDLKLLVRLRWALEGGQDHSLVSPKSSIEPRHPSCIGYFGVIDTELMGRRRCSDCKGDNAVLRTDVLIPRIVKVDPNKKRVVWGL